MVGSVPETAPLLHLWTGESCKSVRLMWCIIVGYRHVGVKLFCKKKKKKDKKRKEKKKNKFRVLTSICFLFIFQSDLGGFFFVWSNQSACFKKFGANKTKCTFVNFCISFDVLMLIVFWKDSVSGAVFSPVTAVYLYKTFSVYTISPSTLLICAEGQHRTVS